MLFTINRVSVSVCCERYFKFYNAASMAKEHWLLSRNNPIFPAGYSGMHLRIDWLLKTLWKKLGKINVCFGWLLFFQSLWEKELANLLFFRQCRLKSSIHGNSRFLSSLVAVGSVQSHCLIPERVRTEPSKGTIFRDFPSGPQRAAAWAWLEKLRPQTCKKPEKFHREVEWK